VKGGRQQEFEVRVVEQASGEYWCEAVSEDGETDAVGSAAESVRDAISSVQWWELDEA
jgi:hypothetical protein